MRLIVFNRNRRAVVFSQSMPAECECSRGRDGLFVDADMIAVCVRYEAQIALPRAVEKQPGSSYAQVAIRSNEHRQL